VVFKIENNKFYNDNAYALVKWALKEKNRIKSSKIMKSAYKLESNYIKFYGIPPRRYPKSLIMAYLENSKENENTIL